MHHTSVVIIGAGQAGLAVSYLLTRASVEHVVLERGRTAEAWRSRRWDSMRLLTPNWMSRLPGWSYAGPDPAGFMPAGSVADYLSAYRDSFRAPVLHQAAVRSVAWDRGRFRVVSEKGCWVADAVVVATGYCDEPAVPPWAREMDPGLRQLTPDRYHQPGDVPDGGVLIVGASATGVQLADELAGAGRDVVLAVGRHTRLPRRYRGVDIMWWLSAMGALDRRIPAGQARVPEPSLQIVGRDDGRDVGLGSLARRGIRLTGRVSGVRDGLLELAGDLPVTTAAADRGLDRLLDRIDEFAVAIGLANSLSAPARPAPTSAAAPADLPSRLDLRANGIRSVVWATGYSRRYPWLHLPVVDADGEIRHTAGRTAVPGLLVMGMRRQTRRSSTFLDGVRHDAALLVDHLRTELLAGPESCRRAS